MKSQTSENMQKHSTLMKRILTAVILAPIVVAAILLLTPFWFAIATAIILLFANWEWNNLVPMQNLYLRMAAAILMLGLFLGAFNFVSWYGPRGFGPIIVLSIAFVWWLILAAYILYYQRQQRFPFTRSLKLVTGFINIGFCFYALNLMFNLQFGNDLVLYFIVLIWIADTSAYFIGKRFGWIKLAANVSPKKTIEGVVGALVVSLIWAMAWTFILPNAKAHVWLWCVWSLVAVIFSIFGDLFISVLKRSIKLKDSGNLLPGHGGLLDRIDSLIAAAPIFALGYLLIGML